MSRFRPRAWSKSNSSRLLRAGNRAARMRPSPPWDSRAETSRCRQATRNSSCVQDSARARSASRATASRSVGAFSARVRKATSAVRSRGAVLAAGVGGHHATVRRVGRSGRARCRSRPGPAARPRARRRRVAARPARCGAAPAAAWRARVGDALVPGPDRGRGRRPAGPSQSTRTRSRSAIDLDPAADHRRVHRVVVGVQADVVVAGQPGRGPPPGRRRRPAAAPASPARSAAIRSVGAQPNARRRRVFTSASQPLQLGVEVRRAR